MGLELSFCGKSGVQSWCPCNPDVFSSLDHVTSWASSFPSSGSAHLVPVRMHPSLVVPVQEERSTAQVAQDQSETRVKETDASDHLWIQCSSRKSVLMSSGSTETQSSPFPLPRCPDTYENVAVALQWCSSQKKRQLRLCWHCRGRATALPERSWDRLPAQLSMPFPRTHCSSCNTLGSSKPQICHLLI